MSDAQLPPKTLTAAAPLCHNWKATWRKLKAIYWSRMLPGQCELLTPTTKPRPHPMITNEPLTVFATKVRGFCAADEERRTGCIRRDLYKRDHGGNAPQQGEPLMRHMPLQWWRDNHPQLTQGWGVFEMEWECAATYSDFKNTFMAAESQMRARCKLWATAVHATNMTITEDSEYIGTLRIVYVAYVTASRYELPVADYQI